MMCNMFGALIAQGQRNPAPYRCFSCGKAMASLNHWGDATPDDTCDECAVDQDE